jgi:CubicO group peptidase (beta-lactamase class C family)
MRRLALLLAFTVAAAGCRRGEEAASAAPAETSPSASPAFDRAAFAAAVGALAAAALEKGPVAGLSIAVARGDDVLLAQGYGMADREAGVAATADTSYPVASVSKHFTAAAILKLAGEGRLSLDAPLGTLIEGTRAPLASVPLRSLMNHTSGLAVRGGPSPRGRALRALRAGVTSAPGTDFAYSNAGFAVLGLVVERVTGQRYADYIKDMVARAGLASTGYCEGAAPVPNRTRDYAVGASGLAPSRYWQYEKFFAAGGLCSSVNDLLRWERALEEGRVIAAADVAAMRTPTTLTGGVPIGYGLGTRMGDTAGHRKLGHTGGGTSNKAVLARYPDDGVLIAVLLNTEAYEARVTAMELEAAIARLLFGVPDQPQPAVVPPEQLRRYTGVYRETSRMTSVVMDAQNQRLTAAGFGPLVPEGGDAFVDEDDPGVSLRFILSGDRVQGFERRHEGWFVNFGRRVGDAGSAAPEKQKPRSRGRARRHRRAE